MEGKIRKNRKIGEDRYFNRHKEIKEEKKKIKTKTKSRIADNSSQK